MLATATEDIPFRPNTWRRPSTLCSSGSKLQPRPRAPGLVLTPPPPNPNPNPKPTLPHPPPHTRSHTTKHTYIQPQSDPNPSLDIGHRFLPSCAPFHTLLTDHTSTPRTTIHGPSQTPSSLPLPDVSAVSQFHPIQRKIQAHWRAIKLQPPAPVQRLHTVRKQPNPSMTHPP